MKKKIKNKKFRGRTGITLLCTGIVFLLLVLSSFISNSLFIYGINRGVLTPRPENPHIPFLIQSGVLSVLIGTGITFFAGHLPLRPIHIFIQAIHDVSGGNFDTKIHIEHPKEFRELSECFNKMTDELSGIEILRSDFINNFSHEFKTPMVSILGFAKMIKSGDLSEAEKEEFLDIIIDESKRLSELANNVLNLSKVESISLLSDFSVFNVSEQIREAILLLENKWEKKQLTFDLQLEEIMLSGSADLLKQVWVNLIDNAVKFSPEGSEISLSLSACAQKAVFSLTDHGCGMDEETRSHIFEKFYQGDTSHSGQGNGLGLALVKKIVELHHGSITAVSTPKKGSSFTVELPVNCHAYLSERPVGDS